MVRSNRLSEILSGDEVCRCFEGGAFAFCSGHPFNRHISIHLKKGEVINPHAFRVAFLGLAGEWIRRKTGQAVDYWWVLENPPPNSEGIGGGLNLHILIHVRLDLQKRFKNAEERWARRAGAVIKRGLISNRGIYYSSPQCSLYDYLRHGLLGVSRYLCKGIEPRAAALFEIRPIKQGLIAGKRSGLSESLGEQHRWQTRPQRRGRRIIALFCPELLGLGPIEEDESGWE